jgi:hypothetical protein
LQAANVPTLEQGTLFKMQNSAIAIADFFGETENLSANKFRIMELRRSNSHSQVFYEDMTIFLASFRTAYAAREGFADPNMLEFQCEAECSAFIAPLEGNRYRYLIQQQYFDIWAYCENRFFKGSYQTRKQTVIVGTAGIGKSASRLLYIALWLEKKFSINFGNIIFNLNNEFYSVDSDGIVVRININSAFTSNSLMLLDPCNFLSNAQSVTCKMLITFTSPSPLSGQVNKPCFTNLDKSSGLYVMKAPTVQEARKVYPNINERMTEVFSWEIDGTRYCSLRWFGYDEGDIPTKLESCKTHLSSEGLWDWIITNTESISKDPRLPFRLCIVEATKSGWEVTGFLSLEIERWIAEWAMGHGRRKVNELANLLENRMLRGGLGIFFERWLFGHLGDKKPLTLDGGAQYIFKEMRIIPSTSIEMNPNVVYKLDRSTFPSIEGYALVGTELLLLQSTVSETHSAARLDDVSKIIATADICTGRKVTICIVYIALRSLAKKFTLPECKRFRVSTTFHVGTVDDSEFCHHSKKILAAECQKRRPLHDLIGGVAAKIQRLFVRNEL